MKRLLMVAFHYPPAAGTSGVQRALRFSSHLPEFGWHPIVLSAHPRAYEHRSEDLLAQIPDEATVIRAQAWDTQRHLSIAGRYPTQLALPDRWWTWQVGGYIAGLRAIRKFNPDAIWSTYPIATAHRLAAMLARKSGLPYIADFRDPMAQEGYPENPRVWRSFASVENSAVNAATICTFTTPSAVAMYQDRYPDLAARMRLLENGYDEGVFNAPCDDDSSLNEGKLTILHSGVVYPSERDPNSLFAALKSIKQSDRKTFERLIVRFRAAHHDEMLRNFARRYEVQEAVQILPSISYADATNEMRRADGLLLLQASNCNAQIPAKLYEYLRAGPPLLIITDPKGDTATAARSAGLSQIATFGDSDSIESVLRAFGSMNTRGMVPNSSAVKSSTRRARTEILVDLLCQAVK